MSKQLARIETLAFVFLAMLAVQPAWSQTQNDFDDHWLAAACVQVPDSRGRLAGRVIETAFGVAVEPRAATTVVLYCDVEADLFHNLIQVIAEDNSPNVSVTATFFEQNIDPPAAPAALASVTTTDQPGLQQAQLFLDVEVEPNELPNLYFVKIEIVRGNKDPVRVYSVSMRDVL